MEEKKDEERSNGGDGAPLSSPSSANNRCTQEWLQKLQNLICSLITNQENNKIRKRMTVSVGAMLFLWYLARRRRRTLGRTSLLSYMVALCRNLRLISSSPSNTSNNTNNNGYRNAVEAPLSLLMQAAKLGTVSRALLMGSDSSIAYQVDGEWKRSALPPNNPSLQSNILELLSENGCTDVSALPESLLARLATPALAALPFVYLYFVYRIMRNLHGKDDAARTYQSVDAWQQTTFEHVAGLDNVVTEVSEVVTYLSNPTLYHGLGARPPQGVLLYGHPGSGKTLLARAVAGEAQCNAFVACSGSDFVDTYVGRGAARVRKLFDEARRDARRGGASGQWWWPLQRRNTNTESTTPSAVIFIDEIDALAKSRSLSPLGNNDERDQTLNQLLAEMDGFAQHSDVTMIVIAATNRPDVLDPAIMRRFDRQVHVGYPNAKGRKAILLVHVRRVNCDVERIDWDKLASMTSEFSGADLRNVVNEAALLAVRDKRPEVEERHLNMAVNRVKLMKASVPSFCPRIC